MVALLAVVAGMLGLILVTLWAVLYQLVRQQGRMLLLIDELERRLPRAARGTCGGGSDVVPIGLAVGAPFDDFLLPDMEERPVALAEFRGSKALLVNWSANCGHCEAIAGELAGLQGALKEHQVRLVLVAHGDADSMRAQVKEHGLEGPILLVKRGQAAPKPFESLGTPSAYLLDEEGNVAEALAIGSEKVPALARRLAGDPPKAERRPLPGEKPLSQSKLERNGLKAGTPAPAFALPDLRGRTVRLEDYRGRKVLLVFTDPHCGPCEELAPHLVRLHRASSRGDGTALVMVGRGEPEENRIKAERFGFEFPVVLQRRWDLSKEYGIFAAPVGFLIDEDGVIAREVAKGVEAILDLATDSADALDGAPRNGRTR